jgi:adenylate kinase
MSQTGEPVKDLVFCGGVHGVGKTSLCQALADQMHAVHVSAGSLLRLAGLVKPSQYAVPDPRENQAYIQAALQEYRERYSGVRIILDGHFCLLAPHRRIQALPCALFRSLEASVLLVVVDDPSTISARLVDRGGTGFNAVFVDRFQRREVARARAIGRHLGLPLRNLTPRVPVADVAQWILDLG